MAEASSKIGPEAAAAVSAVVSTIVTTATASASAAVRVASSASAVHTPVAAETAVPQLPPRKSTAAAAAAGCGIESIGRESAGSVGDNASAGLDKPQGNVQQRETTAGADRSRRLEPLVSRDSDRVIKDEEEKRGGFARGTAQVVYSRGPGDGEAVCVAGRREAAAVKVVEQRYPLYQLTVIVKVALRNSLVEREARAGNDLPYVEAEDIDTAEEVVQVSTSFRKSDIKEALASWVTSSVFGGTEPAIEEVKDNEDDVVADASMRTWVSTGRVPRCAHLVRWVLRRLQLVEVATTGHAESAGTQGWRGEKCWSLVISAGGSDAEGGGGGCADDETRGYSIRSTHGELGIGPGWRSGGSEGLKRHTIPFGSNTQSRDREQVGGKEEVPWWNNEDPWEARSKSDVTPAYDGPAPQPPGYSEAVPPPPYEEAVGLSSHSHNSDRQKTAVARGLAVARRRAPLHPFASDDAESSDTGTLGPPPSYHTTSGRESVFSEEEEEEEEEEEGGGRGTAALLRKNNGNGIGCATGKGEKSRGKQRRSADPISPTVCPIDVPEDLPLPLHGRFYDTDTDPMPPPLRRESRTMRGPEWDRDRRYRERERERERGRRRRRVVGGGQTFGQDTEGPEITREPLEVSSGWRGGRASTAPRGGGRPSALPGRGAEQRGATWVSSFGNGEGRDGDQLRLTSYLEDCKRKLVEAEERRRRAEADAVAAERLAWKNAGNSKRGADDAARRAWAKAATQRVLDLTLVTERVRQEEQKGRVAAARASNKVAHSKQPFRERRGRSQKGPWIGPSVPPTNLSGPQRDMSTEAALRSFYWDEHGRRYNRGGTAPGDRRSGELEVALETVRRMAAAHLVGEMDFIEPFRDLDADGDGRLSLPELGAALRRAGVRLSLSQVTALFRHFDEGVGLDTIGRRRLLWEFVDTRRLLDQWRIAGDARGGPRARAAIFRDRANLADSGETLSRRNFSRALKELDIQVHGWEAHALFDRFEVDEGENIDWRGFVSFMQGAESEEKSESRGVHGKGNLARGSEAAQGLRYDPQEDSSWREHATDRGYQKPRGRGDDDGGLKSRSYRWNDVISSSTNNNNNNNNNNNGTGDRDNTKTKHREFRTLRRRREDAALLRTGPAAGATAHRGGLFERGNVWSYPDKSAAAATLAALSKETRAVTATTDRGVPARRRPNSSSSSSSLLPESEPGPWESDSRGWGARVARASTERGGRQGKARDVVSTAQASKLIDELLEDQQELEEFLREELAKRKGLGEEDGEEPGQRVGNRRRGGGHRAMKSS